MQSLNASTNITRSHYKQHLIKLSTQNEFNLNETKTSRLWEILMWIPLSLEPIQMFDALNTICLLDVNCLTCCTKVPFINDLYLHHDLYL